MSHSGNAPIAIVGTSCRLPGGATSPSKFWDLLYRPRDLCRKVPEDRFNAGAFYDPDPEHPGTSNVTSGYFLDDDPSRFDAGFFSINHREAEAIDPQQRLSLELVYEALESAGHSMESMRGSKTGVFAGVMGCDYYDMQMRDIMHLSQYHSTGTARSILSNRVSYFYDWKGPSMTIDTACSSSLVAVHLAVQSLRNQDCDTAVVFGVNLILGPEMFIHTSNLHMLSPNGRCQMWDSCADGYARGEGAVVLILKKVADARSAGDHFDCIIRESGVNSDGRTPGITMPSAQSQMQLIRSTFEKAGLDPLQDRCQYFEAHGTGTQAGDSAEATAINSVFCSYDGNITNKNEYPLLVGSAKTVIGHLEGAAGVVGVLKASLAIQNAVIPPNLHCKTLNRSIKPIYNGMRIPMQPEEWPMPRAGETRRACVNSFGFGGTNAHVILEAVHLDSSQGLGLSEDQFVPAGPFVFSAASQEALQRTIRAQSAWLSATPSIDLQRLSWTLFKHRATHPFKAAYVARTSEKLIEELDKSLPSLKDTQSTATGNNFQLEARHRGQGILGIFTGQGAQWPRMGSTLLRHCKVFANTIAKLDASLQALPSPSPWSLADEIQRDEPDSRVYDAEIAQPLCTAIQIALVDVLSSAGVSFDAVVGHSSGEIAAAYAARCMSAEAAIQIAYYRGLSVAQDAVQPDLTVSMMALNCSAAEAKSICKEDQFLGKIFLAANNAPFSTTVSGQLGALEEIRDRFVSQGRAARVLRVDQAYHSPFISGCSSRYLAALQHCQIKYQPPSGSTWTSSVHGYPMDMSADPLDDTYWVDNLVNPVLFREAVDQALQDHGPFRAALEVGAHPALRVPVSQTLKQSTETSLPYCGTLKRGVDDFIAIAESLAFLWQHDTTSSIDLTAFWKACKGGNFQVPSILKDLPSYPWDHSHAFWRESRLSKEFRLREQPIHQLLGVRSTTPDGQYQWRNILGIDDIPWVRGHRVQNEPLFPAAGYCCMAIEASEALCEGRAVKLVELEEMQFESPLPVEECQPIVEVCFTLRKVVDNLIYAAREDEEVSAAFSCVAGKVDSTHPLRTLFTGKVRVHFGQLSPNIIPKVSTETASLQIVPIDDFYEDLANIGLEYSGIFRGLNSARRRLFYGQTTADKPSSQFKVHPALLDWYFQSMFIAYSSPGDRTLWAPFLPQRIERIRFNPMGWSEVYHSCNTVDITSHITATIPARDGHGPAIVGDIEASLISGSLTEVQVEGLTCIALSPAQADQDRTMFMHMSWKPDISNGIIVDDRDTKFVEDLALVEACERLSLFYYLDLRSQFDYVDVPVEHRPLFDFIDYLLPIVSRGDHPTVKADWLRDDANKIKELIACHANSIDVQTITAVGQNLAEVVSGSSTMLEHMHSLLERLYMDAIGLPASNYYMSLGIEQIAHRYPQMKILEIGAGTGSTTASVLEALGHSFASYTFTDVSSGFFPNARERFDKWSSQIEFRTLDVEQDPTSQDFEAASYDLIIASNIFHATSRLGNTLTNVRTLLKPGGYLAMVEMTGEIIRVGFMMCGLSGWWLGQEDGRRYSPTQTCAQWDSHLKSTGFSGVESVVHDSRDRSKHAFSVIISRAIDPLFDSVIKPLSTPSPIQEPILIIGGQMTRTTDIISEAKLVLEQFSDNVIVAETIEKVEFWYLHPPPHVLYLGELDNTLFSNINSAKFAALQRLIHQAKAILWVSHDRLSVPYSNMLAGFSRCIRNEVPELNMQLLDIDKQNSMSSSMLIEAFIRLIRSCPPSANRNQLWTCEPELAIMNGRLMIPRVVPIRDMNAQLNCFRRVVTSGESQCSITKQTLEAGGLAPTVDENAGSSNVTIAIQASTLRAVQLSADCFLFLVRGIIEGTEQRVIAFSGSNEGLVSVPISWVIAIPESMTDDAQLLANGTCYLLAHAISSMHLGKKILLHNSDERVLWFMRNAAGFLLQGSELLTSSFSTSSEDKTHDILFHPQLTRRLVHEQLPHNLDAFVDLSAFELRHMRCTHTIIGCLPPSCAVVEACDFLSSESIAPASPDAFAALQLLKDILMNQVAPKAPNSASHQHSDDSSSLSALVRVPSQDEQALFTPLDASTLFKGDKTYLLVGLTGQMGQSMCRWMVNNGARFIVMASRNPSSDRTWCHELERKGITIKIQALDICDRLALTKLLDDLSVDFPPIAGVANAAMVLSDTTFANMTIDDFHKATNAKVIGSQNLDGVFSDNTLDFFLMFSSLSSVVGNIGQSNYAAANMYMAALAQQRRNRGLAGSVMDLGMIIGVGHMNTAPGQIKMLEDRYDYTRLSEQDLHTIFAEAIIAGRPGSKYPVELVTGLNLASEDHKPLWYENPIFSHHRTRQDEQKDTSVTSTKESVPLRQKILDAPNENEAIEILQSTFIVQLAQILQQSASSINAKQPLIELGVDSLMAVEISSRMFKDLEHKVSVLKILSGLSAFEICQTAIFEARASQPGNDVNVEKPIANSVNEHLSIPDIPESLDDTKLIDAPAEIMRESIVVPAPIENGVPRQNGFITPLHYLRRERISYRQSRLWYLLEYFDDPTAYNNTWMYEISGHIDITKLKRAFRLALQRHEALRTAIFNEKESGNAIQAVLPAPQHTWKHVQIADEKSIEAELTIVERTEHNLESGHALAIALCTLSEDKHYLIVGYHHLILDGTAWQIVMRDVARIYDSEVVLSPPAAQYIDYTIDEREILASDLIFWKTQFTTLPSPLELFPFALQRYRKTIQRPSILTHEKRLPADITRTVRKTSKELGVTPMHFHLAILQILLLNLSNSTDVCIGMGDASRHEEEFAEVVGFMTNLLPLRLRSQASDSFANVVRNTKNVVFSALEHSKLSFDRLLAELDIPRDASSQAPLCQVVLNYGSGMLNEFSLGDSRIKYRKSIEARHPQDLVLTIGEDTDGSTILQFAVQDYLYTMEHAEVMADVYSRLLQVFSHEPKTYVGHVDILDLHARIAGTALGKGPTVAANFEGTLFDLIVDLIRLSPDEIVAKDDSGRTINRHFLTKKAAAIANILRGSGVGNQDPVCVLGEPTVDILCSIIAIWAVGAIYVPVDIQNPVERNRIIVQNSKATTAITSTQPTIDYASHLGFVNIISPENLKLNEHYELSNIATLDDVAVILHTSGSTGIPKGVLLTHRNIKTQIEAVRHRFQLEKPVVLHQSGIGFDMSLLQILLGLSLGGTVVMTSARRDPTTITKVMAAEDITLTVAVPSEYSMWLRYGAENLSECTQWRLAISGGEILTTNIIRGFTNIGLPKLELINGYGPSEASMSCCMATIDYRSHAREDSKSLTTVGHPLPNYEVFIADKEGRPLPPGWAGEICIRGSGVSPGYLGVKAENSDHSAIFSPEERIYKSGDKGLMDANGFFIFLGRLEGDTQVKLRGNRIELSDISSTIVTASHGRISECAVILKDDEDPYLVAFVVVAFRVFTRSAGVENVDGYLQTLMKTLPLPSYMRPTIAFELDSIPVTTNGKVDLKALQLIPTREMRESLENSERLMSSERAILDIWKEVLHGRKLPSSISQNSDFFAVGGDSILLLKVLGKMRRQFKPELMLRDLLEDPTLEGMAKIAFIGEEQHDSMDCKESVIDWDVETVLPDLETDVALTSPEPVNVSGNLHVLLTGATGFLGRSILEHLLGAPEVSTVYCVAVRSSKKLQDLTQHSKIAIYEGDLSASNLGLSADDFKHLMKTTDIIIQNGARVSFLQPYSSLRAPNVLSTKELVRLAAPRRIPIHYVSTAGIGALLNLYTLPESSVENHIPPPNADGYNSSKWAGEVLLEKANRVLGIPVTVHRPTSIVGPGAPNSDVLLNMLEFSRRLTAVPRLENWTGELDLVHVETVARTVMRDVLDGSNDGIRFTNICGERKIPVSELYKLVSEDSGMVGQLDLIDWVEKARAVGLDKGIAEWLVGLKGVEKRLPTTIRSGELA